MAVERYRTLSSNGEGIYRELASKFIGTAAPIADEQAFKHLLDGIMRDHPSARHFCYGWVLGDACDRYRANDDGEPASTAGKPILRQIQNNHLTYTAVIVVRYFGGTLLGKPGLIHAYGEAARLALHVAPVVEHVVMEACSVTCGYDRFDVVKSDVHSAGGRIIESTFTEHCNARIELPIGVIEALTPKWLLAGVLIEDQ